MYPLCFEQKCEKYHNFSSKNNHFTAFKNHCLLHRRVYLIIGPCLRNCLFGIADPGVHRVGGSVGINLFFPKKKMEVSASNPFEMQAKLYADLTDDLFRYYSVTKNSLLKYKTSLSEPQSEAINPTIEAIRNGFSDVLHFATGIALQGYTTLNIH